MAHAATPLAAESPDLLADCAAAVAAARGATCSPGSPNRAAASTTAAIASP